MVAWRGEYTDWEWLQMGVFLIGLPIAAVLGALVGLVGRWKRGRVMTAALVGLGGAAVVSLVLFLTFLLFFTIYFNVRGETIVGHFNQVFGWQVTWMPLLCAAVIACLAGIGLRARPRNETSRLVSVSMRQLLLLQVYTFATLGCWTGLRVMALERLTTLERAHRNWASEEGWQVLGRRGGEPFGISGIVDATNEARGIENRRFLKAVDEPWLKELHLQGIGDPGLLELEKLRLTQKLETLWLSSLAEADVNQSVIEHVAEAPALRELNIYGGTFSMTDFGPLARIASLRSIALANGKMNREMIQTLSRCSNLETLGFVELDFTDKVDLSGLPPSLQQLGIYRLKLSRNLSLSGIKSQADLKTLTIRGGRLTRDEVEEIASLPKLQTLQLDCEIRAEDMFTLKALSAVKALTLVQPLPTEKRIAYRQAILELVGLPTLTSITFNADCILEPDEGEWGAFALNAANEKDIETRFNLIADEVKKVRKQKGLGEVQTGLTRSMMTPVAPTPTGSGSP